MTEPLPSQPRLPSLDEALAGLSHIGVAEWSERLREDQRVRWEAGEPVRVEDYLRRLPALAEQTDALLDLVYGEVVLREERGERVRLEEYLERFPEHAGSLARQWEVHQALIETQIPGAGGEARRTAWPSLPGYDVLAELGRGGNGVVYRARQRSLNRLVAIKMIDLASAVSTQQLARFRHEAELLARLQHPHIVGIYKVSSHEGKPFFVLEYVAGGSLEDRLDGRPWSPAAAAALLETLARTVAAVHDQGIVHRDLKPANVLLSAACGFALAASEESTPNPQAARQAFEDIDPKIADFGLAKLLAEAAPAARPRPVTEAGQVLGTPLYMAPEQVRGEAAGPAADLHALGVILYELLTGRHPYRDQSVIDTLQRIVYSDPQPPTRFTSSVPADLEAICLKCLAKDPAKRYAGARELAEDLRRFRAGFPVQARSVGALVRLRMWARRQPAVAALSLTVLTVLLGGLVAVASQWWRAEKALANETVARGEAEEALVAAQKARATAEKAQTAEKVARQRVEQQKVELARSLDESQATSSRSLVALARQSMSNREFSQAEVWLDSCPPTHREWEWQHLRSLCRVRLLEIGGRKAPLGHYSQVQAVAIHPDGTRFVTAGGEGSDVRIWGPRGRLRRILDMVAPIAFSPKGRWLAGAGPRGGVRLCRMNDGKAAPLRMDEGGRMVQALAYRPDGRELGIVDTDGAVWLWTAAEDEGLRGPPRQVPLPKGLLARTLAWSADGRMLALVGLGGQVALLDGGTLRPLTLPSVTAGGSKVEREVRLRPPKGVQVVSVAFPPTGPGVLTAASDGSLRLWDVATGDVRQTRQAHASAAIGLSFSRDGRRLASLGRDGMVRLWDFPALTELARFPGVGAMTLDGPGQRLLVASRERRVVLWACQPPAPPEPLVRHGDTIHALAFEPHSGLLASAGRDHTVQWHDPRTRRPDRPPLKLPASVLALAYHPDGRLLAMILGSNQKGKETGELHVLDRVTGRRVRLGDRGEVVSAVAFSGDGKHLAAASREGTVWLWDGRTLQPRQTWRGKKVRGAGLAFHPDHRTLAIGLDAVVQLWDVDRGALRRSLPLPVGVNVLAWSPDGRRLAGGLRNASVQVWDLDNSPQGRTLTGHTGRVRAVAWTPDGRRLASASADGSVRLWDPARDREVLTLSGHNQVVQALAFSADGRFLASGGRDQTVLLHEAPP
jgi:WD40 repeat protein